MAVRVESEEVPKGLYGNDGAGDRIFLRNDRLKEGFKRIPGTPAEL